MTVGTESKVILVTGCSKGGIGFALCEEFAAAGCKVYATARRDNAMDGFSHEKIEKIALDVTDEVNRKSVINKVLRESGRIDVLVNNAGVLCPGPILDVDLDTARNTFEANFFGPLRLAQLIVPHMAEQGGGIIVNIGSIAGNVATPWNGTYSSTKAALHLMNDALAMECSFLNKNIKVMLIAPGAVKSNIARNGAAGFDLPPNSLFKQFTQIIHKRIMVSQGENALTAEDFSRQVVPRVLDTNPPGYMTLGGFSTMSAIAQWLPRSLVRWGMGKMWNKLNQS
ncbi:oxidoreductase [Thelephora ganbajun]|uniref:Oxidoreductase n=1 Tax=Thelephora ganbajun TaxID=370292 RepID=A0ACB6Z1I5_THEGA|nr:oxidoreductase [Thelephora ganbajun]